MVLVGAIVGICEGSMDRSKFDPVTDETSAFCFFTNGLERPNSQTVIIPTAIPPANRINANNIVQGEQHLLRRRPGCSCFAGFIVS